MVLELQYDKIEYVLTHYVTEPLTFIDHHWADSVYSMTKFRNILTYLQPQKKCNVKIALRVEIFSGCCVNPRLEQESSEPAADTTSSHVRTATAAKATASGAALVSVVIRHLWEREKTWARCSSPASSLTLFTLSPSHCICLSSFSSLNKPSRSPLTSLHVQQLDPHCSLAPPALAPVNQLCTFTSGATFQHLDKTFTANKQMKWLKSSCYLSEWASRALLKANKGEHDGHCNCNTECLHLRRLPLLQLVQSFDSSGDSRQLLSLLLLSDGWLCKVCWYL